MAGQRQVTVIMVALSVKGLATFPFQNLVGFLITVARSLFPNLRFFTFPEPRFPCGFVTQFSTAFYSVAGLIVQHSDLFKLACFTSSRLLRIGSTCLNLPVKT